MQRHIFKIITLILIISLFSLTLKTFATDEPTNNMARSTNQNTANEDDNSIYNESSDEEDHPEDVHSTSSNNSQTNTNKSSSPSQTREPSVSTLSTIPEANLGLNNVLNVILIAVGVVIILLAIAILIRLKG